MEAQTLQKYLLDYLTMLSKVLGNRVLGYYGDIVEDLEQKGDQQDLEDQFIRRYTLLRLYHLEPDSFKSQLSSDKCVNPQLSEDWQQMPHRVIEAFLPMVRQVAASYHQPSEIDNEQKFNDLIGAGQEALFIAAEKYFLRPKGDFRAYAWDFIRTRIKDEQGKRHPVPFKVRRKLQQLSDLREEFSYSEYSLDNQIIVDRLSLSADELPELLQMEAIWGNGLDFENDVEIDDIEEADLRPDSLGILLQIENQAIVQQALDSLDERERQIIFDIYFNEKKMRQVVSDLEISLSVGKKLHKRALHKMLNYVDELK